MECALQSSSGQDATSMPTLVSSIIDNLPQLKLSTDPLMTVVEMLNKLSLQSPPCQAILILIAQESPKIYKLPELSNYESLLPTVMKPSTDPLVSMFTVTNTLNSLSLLAQKHGLTVFAIVQTHYHQDEDCNYTSVWYLRGPAVEGSPAWAMVHMRGTSTILTYALHPNSRFKQLIIRTKNDRELHHDKLLMALRPETAVKVFNEHFDVICCPNNSSNIILDFMIYRP